MTLLIWMCFFNWGHLTDVCWCWYCRQLGKCMEAIRLGSLTSSSWGSQRILRKSGSCFGCSCPCTWSRWWETRPSFWPLALTPACTLPCTSSWPTSPSPTSSLSPTQSPRCWWTFSPRTKSSHMQGVWPSSTSWSPWWLWTTSSWPQWHMTATWPSAARSTTSQSWALGSVFCSSPRVGHLLSSMASCSPSSWPRWLSVGPGRYTTSSVRCMSYRGLHVPTLRSLT